METRFTQLVALACANILQQRSRFLLERRGSIMATYVNDSLGNSIAASGYYEYEELEQVSAFLEKNGLLDKTDIFLDVGANIGNHTLYFRDQFEAIYCYEVNPRTQILLDFNVGHYEHISTKKYGLADFNGFVEIVENTTNFGGTRISGAKQERGGM